MCDNYIDIFTGDNGRHTQRDGKTSHDMSSQVS